MRQIRCVALVLVLVLVSYRVAIRGALKPPMKHDDPGELIMLILFVHV